MTPFSTVRDLKQCNDIRGTPELTTLVLFSDPSTSGNLHNLRKRITLQKASADLLISHTFFQTTDINDKLS